MAEHVLAEPVAHIRFEGRSLDIRLGDLDLDRSASNIEVRQALARYLEIPVTRLRDYVIDRHETGNLTVRPEAVFG
jgi:hypothetical protein